MTVMLAHALKLAADGHPVFPCLPDKRPACPHGFKDAATERDAVRQLWREYPGLLIGVATGAASGFDCLDIDTKHDEAKTWWCGSRDRIPNTRTHRTQSGGLHLLFHHNGLVRCGTGKIAPGVDTRADGGYVIWWPATGLPVLSSSPLAPWPDWLLAKLLLKPQPQRATSSTAFPGNGWLRGLARIVAQAAEGQRNQLLFWAACRGGEAVRDGKADEVFVIDVLVEAAAHAGLPRPEAERTIQSGMRQP